MAKKKSDKETEPKNLVSTETILRFFKERNHTFCNRIDQCNFCSLSVTGIYLFLLYGGRRPKYFG